MSNQEIHIKFVPKEKIYPYFGFCHYEDGRIEIQQGLSKFEVCSLLVHEFGHLDDSEDNEGFKEKELESIGMSIFYPIIGTIMIAFKTLFNKDRRALYYKRNQERR